MALRTTPNIAPSCCDVEDLTKWSICAAFDGGDVDHGDNDDDCDDISM